MSQSHFTLAFPLTSPADAKALVEKLPPLTPDSTPLGINRARYFGEVASRKARMHLAETARLDH